MKVSLTSQIAEIDREIGQRRAVYPRLVASRSMRQSMADLQVHHLEAVRETLLWLQANELTIKQRLSY